MIQPQAQAPQPQQPSPAAPQIAPQAAPSAAPGPQMAQAQAPQQQPSGRAGQPYNPNVLPLIEKHLNTLPKEQQGFLAQYMTPELATLFGIVLGQEAFDYFKQFADPKNMLVVQPRPQQAPNSAQQPPQGPPQQSAQSGEQPSQSPQQATTPQPSIMGV